MLRQEPFWIPRIQERHLGVRAPCSSVHNNSLLSILLLHECLQAITGPVSEDQSLQKVPLRDHLVSLVPSTISHFLIHKKILEI